MQRLKAFVEEVDFEALGVPRSAPAVVKQVEQSIQCYPEVLFALSRKSSDESSGQR